MRLAWRGSCFFVGAEWAVVVRHSRLLAPPPPEARGDTPPACAWCGLASLLVPYGYVNAGDTASVMVWLVRQCVALFGSRTDMCPALEEQDRRAAGAAVLLCWSQVLVFNRQDLIDWVKVSCRHVGRGQQNVSLRLAGGRKTPTRQCRPLVRQAVQHTQAPSSRGATRRLRIVFGVILSVQQNVAHFHK